MKLIRYQTSPFYTPSSYPTLREEMDRLFDVAFPALSSLQRGGLFGDLRAQFPVDLYQGKDTVTVRAELPGFRKEDISAEVENDLLTVTAHQKTEAKQDDKATATQERRSPLWQRQRGLESKRYCKKTSELQHREPSESR